MKREIFLQLINGAGISRCHLFGRLGSCAPSAVPTSWASDAGVQISVDAPRDFFEARTVLTLDAGHVSFDAGEVVPAEQLFVSRATR